MFHLSYGNFSYSKFSNQAVAFQVDFKYYAL